MAKELSRIVWSPAAQQDLIDIWGYFAGAASPETADKLLHEIRFAADRLSTDPRMYRVRLDLMPDLPGGLRAGPVHPHTSFYRMAPAINDENKDVQIVRVLHERRDFPTILPKE